MIQPLDPFAQALDSHDSDLEPGFYLLDDASGRFVVDRETGVVSVASDDMLARERGVVHPIRLRVIEASGAKYELDMQLRVTGRVPQMVGAEEFAALAGLTDETILTATRVPVLTTQPDLAPEAVAIAPVAAAPVEWTRFSIAQGHGAHTPRMQPRRSFIVAEPPATNENASLAFDGLPASFPSHLPWSL